MARIRHIAFTSNHPGRTAAFYKQAFGFRELKRFGLGHDVEVEAPAHCGVILTDGDLNIAILKLDVDQIGVGLDHVGFHHFGCVVDDIDEWTNHLLALGAESVTGVEDIPPTAHFEIKFRGPDDVVFDISHLPWPGSSPVPDAEKHVAATETATP
jgi:catechol 2,3-dioxygenase-like lactoylglutathione lyase family enzyme